MTTSNGMVGAYGRMSGRTLGILVHGANMMERAYLGLLGVGKERKEEESGRTELSW